MSEMKSRRGERWVFSTVRGLTGTPLLWASVRWEVSHQEHAESSVRAQNPALPLTPWPTFFLFAFFSGPLSPSLLDPVLASTSSSSVSDLILWFHYLLQTLPRDLVPAFSLSNLLFFISVSIFFLLFFSPEPGRQPCHLLIRSHFNGRMNFH